jgi:hypothetical protein
MYLCVRKLTITNTPASLCDIDCWFYIYLLLRTSSRLSGWLQSDSPISCCWYLIVTAVFSREKLFPEHSSSHVLIVILLRLGPVYGTAIMHAWQHARLSDRLSKVPIWSGSRERNWLLSASYAVAILTSAIIGSSSDSLSFPTFQVTRHFHQTPLQE